jgi:preprotein translocase subunit SecG
MLRNEGGVVGKIISRLIAVLSTVAFVVAPTIYVISEATKNVRLFGWNDTLTVTTSIVSAVLCMCSLVVVGLAGRIKAEE